MALSLESILPILLKCRGKASSSCVRISLVAGCIFASALSFVVAPVVMAEEPKRKTVQQVVALFEAGDYDEVRKEIEPSLGLPQVLDENRPTVSVPTGQLSNYKLVPFVAEIYERGLGVEKSHEVARKIYAGLFINLYIGFDRAKDLDDPELIYQFLWKSCDLAEDFVWAGKYCGQFSGYSFEPGSEPAVLADMAEKRLAEFIDSDDADVRFIRAIQVRRLDIAQAAIDDGADVNARFPFSTFVNSKYMGVSWKPKTFTAASHAAYLMRSDEIAFLVENGVDLNVNPDPSDSAPSAYEHIAGATITYNDERGKVSGQDFLLNELVANGYKITERDVHLSLEDSDSTKIPRWIRNVTSPEVIENVLATQKRKAEYYQRRNDGKGNDILVAQFKDSDFGQHIRNYFSRIAAIPGVEKNLSNYDVRINWPGNWGDETVVAKVQEINYLADSIREKAAQSVESEQYEFKEVLSGECSELGGVILTKFDKNSISMDSDYGWCVSRTRQEQIFFSYNVSCFRSSLCPFYFEYVFQDRATDHGLASFFKSAKVSGLSTNEEAEEWIAKAEAERQDLERVAAQATEAERQEEERLLRQRNEQARRNAQVRMEAAATWRMNLALGMETHCGMVIQTRESLVEIQTIVGNKWFRVDQLYAPGTAQCRFFNEQYQDPVF